MDDVKNCSKCKNILLKTDFHKIKNISDGFQSQCKFCTKRHYVDNQDRLLNKQKFYDKENGDKINARMNEYIKNRIKTDVNFRLIRMTRWRIHHALNGKSKSTSTKKILGIDVDSYRKWIEFQFAPEMT